MDTINYTYQFEFKNGRKEEFQLELDNQTLSPTIDNNIKLPDWTRLEFKQCNSCPLTLETIHCPLAKQIAPLVDTLKDIASIEETQVTVIQDERVISNDTSAQEGISSLMGILTAVSGCPLTQFFKPMARFHLPFANMEETFYRATSMYMLGQYYRWKDNMSADMDMVGLPQYYSNVAMVNKNMAERLKDSKREDAAVNALIILDMFVKSIPDAIEDVLDEFKPLFSSYLQEKNIV